MEGGKTREGKGNKMESEWGEGEGNKMEWERGEGEGNKRVGERGEGQWKGERERGEERGEERKEGIKRKFMVSEFKLFQFKIVNPSYIQCM